MARIPGEDIERLKQEVSLQRLVEAQGIELKRHGADLLGLIRRMASTPFLLSLPPKNGMPFGLRVCQGPATMFPCSVVVQGVLTLPPCSMRRTQRAATTWSSNSRSRPSIREVCW